MKKLLSLRAKHFLTGVSGNDYGGYGGIFKQALGVSAIRSIGNFYTTASLGLLQAGPSGANGGSGVIVDSPVVGARNAESSTHSYLYILGSSGHFYKKDDASSAPTDLGATQQVVSPANGIAIFQPAGGTKYMYYWQQAQFGRVDVSSAPANRTANSLTGAAGDPWKDNYYTTNITSTNNHHAHQFLDSVFFCNGYYIGRIQDNGSADVTITPRALDFPQVFEATCLADDGQFLVAALAANKSSLQASTGNKIIFWDTNASSWQLEFPIDDMLVAMKRVGPIIYGLGARGVYSISTGGVKKIWQKGTSIGGSGASRIVGPGMLSSFNDALVIAGDNGEVALLGKPDPVLPGGYHTPILIDAGSSTQVTFVDSQFQNGNFIIGDASTALKMYPMIFTSNQQSTGVTAETVFMSLSTPAEIMRIDVIFGRILASGDSLTVQIMGNDGSTYTTYGVRGATAITFATDGALRRATCITDTNVRVEDIKLKLTFGGGAVGIHGIDVYGDELTEITTT